MSSVLSAAAVYLFVLVFVRLSGRRTLSEMTTFDFVVLLIISEGVSQGMVREDFSLTNAFLVALTLIFLDVVLSLIKQRWPPVDRWLSGVPMIIVENGRPLKDRMDRARVDEEDVLEAARALRGLERMDQIKYAVLERGGDITIIPRRGEPETR